MTYSRHPDPCSGYCSGWSSFLGTDPLSRQLKALECALDSLRRGMNVALRNDDAAVAGYLHDGE
jgi:hypothetical protein